MVLTGCAQKATPCSSERMRGLIKDEFSESVARAIPSAGVDLFTAGVIRNMRVEDIETDDVSDDGSGAVCRATLRFDFDGKPTEHSFQYLVLNQNGDYIFRNTGAWPMAELRKQLKMGSIAPLLEKENEIAALEKDMSDDRARMSGIPNASQDSDSEDADANPPTAAEIALIFSMKERSEARAKKLESAKFELESMRQAILAKAGNPAR